METFQTTAYEASVVWRLINSRPPAAYMCKEVDAHTTTRFLHILAKMLQAAESD